MKRKVRLKITADCRQTVRHFGLSQTGNWVVVSDPA